MAQTSQPVPEHVLLEDLFQRLAREIGQTHDIVAGLETTICALASSVRLRHEDTVQLQQVDLVLQRLCGLRDFALALATAKASTAHIDIASAQSRVSLEALRGGLGRDAAESPNGNDAFELL